MFTRWKQKSIHFFTGQFQVLTFSMLILLIVSPYFRQTLIGVWSMSILYGLILLAAIYSLKEKKHNLIFFSSLALIYILVSLTEFVWTSVYLELFKNVLLIVFGITSTVAIYTDIAATQEVKTDTYFAAISVYLLIGITYGTIYSLVEFLAPGSFVYQYTHLVSSDLRSELIYYSFITLTTVGYGDIVVVSAYAKPFVILESITGIFYLAMLVARLVATRK